MVGRTNFHAHTRRKFGGEAEARAENFHDERIAHAHEFHPATDADAERLEPLRVLVAGLDTAHHGANARGEFIKPHTGGWLAGGIHNAGKLSCPRRKSIAPPVSGALRSQDSREPESNGSNFPAMVTACDLLAVNCATQFG